MNAQENTSAGLTPQQPKTIPWGDWSSVAAVVLISIYVLTSVLIARHRLFWYDEILTVSLSRLPGFSAIWKAVARGVDGMPPTYDMLVHVFTYLPVAPEVSARLPSAIAMALGMLLTFDCARRASDGTHGLIALSLLSCSILPYYGYEARPYALYFMFASLALWLWLNSGASKASATLFGLALFLAVAVHYYAVLCLVPYAAWVVWRWPKSRRCLPKLLAGIFAVACAGVIFLPHIAAMRRAIHIFGNPATLASLVPVYDEFFPYALFPLIGIMLIAALCARTADDTQVATMNDAEQLGWLFVLIPLAGYVLAKTGENVFSTRYFIGLLPGLALAFACLLRRQFRGSPVVSMAALLLFAALGFGKQIDLVRHPTHVRPILRRSEPERMEAMQRLENRIASSASLIVIPAGDLLGLEAHYYSSHPDKYVLLLGAGSSATNPKAPLLEVDRSPIRYWGIDDLKAHAREITMIDPSQENLDELQQAGYQAQLTCDGALTVATFE